MKNMLFITFIALFVISGKTSRGLKFPFLKNYSPSSSAPKPNPVALNGDRAYIIIENRSNSTRAKGGPLNCPVIIKKKTKCLCGLSVCVCSKSEDPETWYVKTFLKGDTRMTPAMYRIKHYNVTSEILSCVQELEKLKNKIKIEKNFGDSLKSLLYPKRLKKKAQCKNEGIFGYPPLVNSYCNATNQKRRTEKDLSFRCECSQCKLQPRPDKSGVLLNCKRCGPIYLNVRNEKSTFTKLQKKKMMLKMRVKFMQYNERIV